MSLSNFRIFYRCWWRFSQRSWQAFLAPVERVRRRRSAESFGGSGGRPGSARQRRWVWWWIVVNCLAVWLSGWVGDLIGWLFLVVEGRWLLQGYTKKKTAKRHSTCFSEYQARGGYILTSSKIELEKKNTRHVFFFTKFLTKFPTQPCIALFWSPTWWPGRRLFFLVSRTHGCLMNWFLVGWAVRWLWWVCVGGGKVGWLVNWSVEWSVDWWRILSRRDHSKIGPNNVCKKRKVYRFLFVP